MRQSRKRQIKPIYDNTFRHLSFRKNFWVGLILLLVIGISIFLVWEHQKVQQRPDKERYPILGTVLEADNGYTDFHKIEASGLSFVYLKATQGTSYIDDQFNSQYDRAMGSDLALGAYHYFSFETTGQQQAQFFISKVGQKIGNLPIVVRVALYGSYADKQPNPEKTQLELHAFVDAISRYYQRKVVVWTTSSIDKKMLNQQFEKNSWPVSEQKKAPKNSLFWQYETDNIELKKLGISVPLSVFNGPKEEFSQLLASR